MHNKNILIIGSNEKFSIENMYLRAFKSLKYNTKLLHVYNIRKNLINKFLWKFFRYFYFFYIRKKIFNYIRRNNNFDLVIIFKGIYLKKNFINKIKKKNKNFSVINIFTDNPLNINYFKDISNRNILKSIPEFDHLFVYSQKIRKKLKKIYKKKFFSYLPFAFDYSLITKKKRNHKVNFDLSFIGTADQNRYETLMKLKDYKIILAGDGWNKYLLSDNIKYIKNVNFLDYHKIINTSKFSLNLLRKQNKCSHNMKTFEIPSMGGLLVTEKNIDQSKFFPENKACLMFKNIKDLKHKLKNCDFSSKKYKRIKKQGLKYSRYNTYKERAKYILSKIYA